MITNFLIIRLLSNVRMYLEYYSIGEILIIYEKSGAFLS